MHTKRRHIYLSNFSLYFPPCAIGSIFLFDANSAFFFSFFFCYHNKTTQSHRSPFPSPLLFWMCIAIHSYSCLQTLFFSFLFFSCPTASTALRGTPYLTLSFLFRKKNKNNSEKKKGDIFPHLISHFSPASPLTHSITDYTIFPPIIFLFLFTLLDSR